MNIREERENLEEQILSKYACLSKNTLGRQVFEEKCPIRTEFQRDRDRILHSKSFRRLKHKTQVFISPEGDHFRTRLTHTLEVSQIGRTIGRALKLNEDLIEAIALGHDLGHTPFGHTGERVLNRLNPKGFCHRNQSLKIVDMLENRNNSKGMNLTYEVREGIINHSGDVKPNTLEGEIVRYADRIAYINHDIDDAIRGGIISVSDLPKDCVAFFGEKNSDRMDNMIQDIILNSYEKSSILLSEDCNFYMDKLRGYMFENVYFNSKAKSEEDKAEYIITELYNYYMNNEKLPKEHLDMYIKLNMSREDIICDYIAGMTDRYLLNLFNDIFVPKPWSRY